MIVGFLACCRRDAFPTVGNFTNVLNQASLAMIIAGGLTLAVIVGELDLSIGFAASLHGVLVTGLIVHDKLPIPLAILHRRWRSAPSSASSTASSSPR